MVIIEEVCEYPGISTEDRDFIRTHGNHELKGQQTLRYPFEESATTHQSKWADANFMTSNCLRITALLNFIKSEEVAYAQLKKMSLPWLLSLTF
jgi:hypothetical protein